MIIDSTENLVRYESLIKGIEHVANFLKTQPIGELPNGRTPVTDEIFGLVMENELKDEEKCLWEAHRKYYDLHVGVRGSERIGYANIGTVEPTMEYNANDDYQLFAGNTEQYLGLNAGVFALFAPQDVHKTSIKPADVQSGEKIRKIVFKIPVNPS